MIIYVDVLFIVNFFITYLLLLLTKALVKSSAKTVRLLASSCLGGLYSLIILADDLSVFVSVLGKLAASVLLVIIAFGFKRITVFVKAVALFYFSNMLFLGVILAVQLIFNSKGAAINNGTVYFDISAPVLLISASLAYVVSIAVIKIYNRTLGRQEIYKLKIFKNGECHTMLAFLDSGNKLTEPFSNYPVIIADSSKIMYDTERIIPFSTVGGDGILQAFRPDKIEISNEKNKIETDKVYIALSEVGEKNYSAILNSQILKM